MNQTYFEWYEYGVNVERVPIATCTLINQRCSEYEWNFNVVDSLVFKVSEVLMSSKKRFIAKMQKLPPLLHFHNERK